MALPTLTRTLDDDFTNTWYEIRPQVTDNILESNVFSLALKEHGCMTPQVGGEYVTRTIGYGKATTQNFDKGSVLTQKVEKLDTLARWDWRYFLVDVNRTLIDDNKNSGPSKIKDYLVRRLGAAKDAISSDLETKLFQWGTYVAAPYNFNGIYDICPNITAESAVGAGSASDTYATGTSNGNINRTNTWWRNFAAADSQTENIANRLMDLNVPYSLNLVPDMRHMFNTIQGIAGAPNFIIMDQAIFETYEDETSDKQQIVRTSFDSKAADLGFQTFTFKGATMAFSSKLASTGHLFMLNLDHIEFVYNPNMWFDMTDWKETANQLEKVAYIACMTSGLITDQPRCHGVMEYSS
jgi:hypothetical protein